jgi:sulfatase maturation enzyme AslB (radical SAM superfamily)
MDDSVIEKSIQLIKTWQKSSGCTICWYGGEPLLKFDLIKKWTPVIKKELPKAKTSITTNGSLITQEVMDFMDEHGIGMLFSLDGPQWVHDRTRVFAGGKPSWDKIDPLKIIKWRPDTEIAWQITPEGVPEPSDLDWMILNGFSKINFNINWLSEWGPEAQEKLRDFMYHAISRVILYRVWGC